MCIRKRPYACLLHRFCSLLRSTLTNGVSLGSGACQLVTGPDTESPFSFPALILWNIMFLSCSHALCDMGTREGAPCKRDSPPRESRSPGHLLSLPFPFPDSRIGNGKDGFPPPLTFSSCLSLPWGTACSTLRWLSLAKSLGRKGSFLVSHDLPGRPEY